MKYEITVKCCFCDERTLHAIDLPEGWAHRYGGIDDEDNGFCPKHAAIAEFADAQCSGCVGGWGDCGLWRAFVFSQSRTITDDYLGKIEKGICPYRVNGTMRVMFAEGLGDIDLSERASARSGQALANAIREYCEEFPT